MLTSSIAIGDKVRVRSARRRDVYFTVSEITPNGLVRAVNDRGGQAIYFPDLFEKIEPAAAAPIPGPVETIDLRPDAPSPHHRPVFDPVPAEFLKDRTAVCPRQGESMDNVLRRFKKSVQKSGIPAAARKHEYFISKPERRRTKAIRARIRRGRGDE